MARTINVQDLPGIQRIEDFIALNRPSDLKTVEFEELLDEVCFELFELRSSTLLSTLRELRMQGKRPRIQTSALMMDEQYVEFFAKRGWDFLDKRGQPLRYTRYIALVIECVMKGYAGHRPDLVFASAEKFGASLAVARQTWMSKKRHHA